MILRATAEDVDALADLEEALFGPDAWGRAAFAEELDAPGRLVLVVIDDVGAVVGYAVTRVVGPDAELFRIAVAREHQRRGYAAALLADATRAAIEAGAERMFLEVSADNRAAREFYRSHGFVTDDRRAAYYRDGSDALLMHRPTRPR